MSDSDDEQDSRTASVGQKRSREISPVKQVPGSDDDASSQSKRPRLDDEESGRGSSPEAQSQPPSTPCETRSAIPPSRSHSPVAHTEAVAPPQDPTPAPLPAAAAPETASSELAQDFISLNDIPSPGRDTSPASSDDEGGSEEGEASDDEPPKESTIEQGGRYREARRISNLIDWSIAEKLIRQAERPSCERLMSRNGPVQPQMLKSALKKGCLASLSVQIPSLPNRTKRKKVQVRSIKSAICRHVARYAFDGIELVGTQGEVGHADNSHVMLKYKSPEHAQQCYQAMAEKKGPKAQDVPLKIICQNSEIAAHIIDQKPFKYGPITQSGWFLQGRVLGVRDLIESGQLDPNSYPGFPDGLQGILKDRHKTATDNQFSALQQGESPTGESAEPAMPEGDSTGPPNENGEAPPEPATNGDVEAGGVHKGESLQELPSAEPTVLEDLEHNRRPGAPGANKDGPRTRIWQLNDYERDLQRLYFQIEGDEEVVRCFICAKEGHMPELPCPSRTCKHCATKDDHFASQCPQQRKCRKCWDRGHDQENCPSKLALTAAEGFTCDLCQQSGHNEDECWYVWHTPPDPSAIHKVTLEVTCYTCGGEGHFGGDCPERSTMEHVLTGVIDWPSARSMNPYLTNPLRAIAPPAKLYRDGEGPALGLAPGPARTVAARRRAGKPPSAAIHLNDSAGDSDDDVDTFLHRSKSGDAKGGRDNRRTRRGGAANRPKIAINAPPAHAPTEPATAPPANAPSGPAGSSLPPKPANPQGGKSQRGRGAKPAGGSAANGRGSLASRISGPVPPQNAPSGPSGGGGGRGRGNARGGSRGGGAPRGKSRGRGAGPR